LKKNCDTYVLILLIFYLLQKNPLMLDFSFSENNNNNGKMPCLTLPLMLDLLPDTEVNSHVCSHLGRVVLSQLRFGHLDEEI